MDFATHTLRREHEAILKMLDVAAGLASRLEAHHAVPEEQLNDTVEFFQVFADRCHHAKEEELLFPALESKGLPRNGGPIAVMLHEHEVGRATVRRMATAAKAYPSDRSAGTAWAAAAREFAALLSGHIQKENNVLFVMAERMLSDAEQTRLAADFERAEEEKIGPGTHERLHATMERLTSQVLAGSGAAK
jgi:hemerythrin-like domain-containing protein